MTYDAVEQPDEAVETPSRRHGWLDRWRRVRIRAPAVSQLIRVLVLRTIDMAKPQPLCYAGFWQRLHASFWDSVLLTITYLLTFNYSVGSRELFIAQRVGVPILMASLSVYLLARFGGTPGKLLVGIRVRQLDGAPITWKHALLRNSVDLIYTMYGVGVFLAIRHRIDYQLIGSLTGMQLKEYWTHVYPVWNYWLIDLSMVYDLSEAVVMLTNERRRAIHDFIAGTVVVIKNQRKPVKKHRKH